MNRKEQIEEAANDCGNGKAVPVIRSMYPSESRGEMARKFAQCFAEGAEWADKNPSREVEYGIGDTLFKQKDIIAQLRSQLSVATISLESISKNSCCEQCQQAKLVAKQALEKIKGMEKSNG